MISVGFLLQDSLEKIGFFEKTFLLANINIKIVLIKFFFFFNNANFQFGIEKFIEKFIQKFYIIIVALSTMQKMELIDKYKFVKAALNKNSEIFIVYMSSLKSKKIIIYVYQIA